MVYTASRMAAKASTPATKKPTKLWILFFAAGLIIFGASAYFAHQGSSFAWETSLFTALNDWPESLYRFMTVMTFFGSTLMALLVVIGTFVFRLYRLALRLSLTILGAYSVVALAKHFVGRDRPLGILQDTHARIAETGMGFPSGHATLITVIMLTILLYLPRRWRWTVPIPIILVCISRIYLGVHLPLDIVGGVALGTAAVAFTWIIPQRLKELLRIN